MKLATFRVLSDDHDRLGALMDDGSMLDLGSAEPTSLHFGSMQALIEAGPAGLEAARALLAGPPAASVIPSGGYRLRPPLPKPEQIRDFLCFEKHLVQSLTTLMRLRLEAAGESDIDGRIARASEAGELHPPQIWYDQPIYYKGNRFAISGPEDVIAWPAYSKLMDYECELACVIGRGGRDISVEDAHDHVFGYTILNDFSARDAQSREMLGLLGPAKGKDFDGANAIGPVIVTADEIGDPQQLTMSVRVNGVENARGSSSSMYWRFVDLIAYVSQSETLHPGEILGSGTVGDGCGLEHNRYLSDGDVVELEIEKIGVLRNRVTRG